MDSKRTRYQIKKSGEDQWEEASEKNVMEKLADRFNPLTPVLSEMLRGKEVITPHGTYRRKN